jgi:outer membrane lipoprotein-sorting protein
VGSEFSYEDISSQEVEKYTYKWLRDELLRGKDCFVLERYPVDRKNSGYTRQVVWMDKDEYRVLKIDYYDRKKSLLKTYNATDYHQYEDRFWRAHRMEITNHQNGKSTLLEWSNFAFGTGLTGRDFDKNSLKRAR